MWGGGRHPGGVSTSDFDGERAAIEGGGMREQGAFPVEENLNGEDVALCQLQQPPDLLVPAHNTHVFLPVLQIHDNLVWIRIRIRGSMLWLMDPDPDPAIFVRDLEGASKKLMF